MATIKKDGTPHASTTGGPGPRNVDMSNWRTRLQASRLKFDDDAKDIFLAHFAQTGLMGASAQAAGVAHQTVRGHLELDPDFNEAYLEAKELYKKRILDHARTLILDGVDEPIIGGQFKDEVVAYKKVYPTNLIAMEMRKVDPDYKERQEIDLKAGGGVLVAPADKSPEDWIREQEELNKTRERPTLDQLDEAAKNAAGS